VANPPLKETEVAFEAETVDSGVSGTLRYVNGRLKGRDVDGLYDLRLGGGGYLTVTYGSSSPTVTAGTWLSSSGVPSTPENSPPGLPFDGTLTAISIGVDTQSPPGSSWGIDLFVNGVSTGAPTQVITTTNGTVTEFADDGLSLDVVKGDRIGVRVASGFATLNKPHVSLVFRLRK